MGKVLGEVVVVGVAKTVVVAVAKVVMKSVAEDAVAASA
jgi:hypothetical protein